MSLVSREVIADSIELVARANHFDALVILVGCDKTIPGAAMALARLDIPGLVLYGGSIAPGSGKARTSRFKTCSRPSARSTAGKLERSRIRGARERGLPWRRRLRRPVHGQHDGHGVRVPRPLAVRQRHGAGDGCGKDDVARQAGALAVDLIGRGPPAAADSDAGGVRERDRVGRGHRRFDQCRPAPDGYRERGGRHAEARRLRSHQRLGAAPGRPQAGRPVRRH